MAKPYEFRLPGRCFSSFFNQKHVITSFLFGHRTLIGLGLGLSGNLKWDSLPSHLGKVEIPTFLFYHSSFSCWDSFHPKYQGYTIKSSIPRSNLTDKLFFDQGLFGFYFFPMPFQFFSHAFNPTTSSVFEQKTNRSN